MNLVVTLAICILASFLFTSLAKRLRISTVVGLIIAGIVIGSPWLEDIILGPNKGAVLALGDMALIILMFLAGLEVSWDMLYEEKKNALYVAAFVAIVPFLSGFVVFFALGYSLATSLVVGVSMSITAEATTARVLMELGKLKTRLGSLIMGAGIIDDVMGLILFSLIGYWVKKGQWTKEGMLLAGAIAAFFAGILVHRFIGREADRIPQLEKALLRFIVPFFFIGMGIHFDPRSLIQDPWLLVIILITAIAGKMFGTLITKPFTGLSLKQLYLVGWGMNSRGAIEIALALIAFRAGFLPVELYSGLVVMAVVTTLMFPFFIRAMVKRDPDIMD